MSGNGWATKPLAEVCDFQNGYAFKSKWYTESGIRLLRNANVSHGFVDWSDDVVHLPEDQAEEFERFRLNESDVVLSLDRPVISTGLKAAILRSSDLPSLLLQRVLRITSKSLLQQYIYRWLFSPQFLDEIDPGRSLGVPHISAKEVGSVPITFPNDKAEQKRIVSILDEAFSAIAKAKENAEKNLLSARELFESYLNRVFTQQGPGWQETTIGETCQLKSGTTVKKALESAVGEMPYVKVADMSFPGNEVEIVSSSRFLKDADVKPKSVFPGGTTIFPKRGGSIMTNKKRVTATPICCDLNIMGVIPPKHIRPKFLYYYFEGVNMAELGSGAAIPQINNYDIDPLPFNHPDEPTQMRLIEGLDAIALHAERLETIYTQKLANLDELKQSLLQKAFTGQLTAAAACEEIAV